ncbi:uncharacterized protein LOC108623540 [Ceratina calcarata]|uniref:Uncharacterized protein LOC108623540 n=1 Tax=Ceratina calcarata TaxID=156304 RepID=A0AAJ7N4U1_9HYME|nr:uncharacterized protein LOC108623540 [Ceratina calcarata]
MALNYFEKLTTKARELDNGIEKLSITWGMPQVLSLINSIGERTEDLDSYVEDVWGVLNDTQNDLRKLRSEAENENEEDSVAQILERAREEYAILKEECDNLYTVFAEYGYHYDLDQTNGNDSKSNEQTLIEGTENLQLVESTPESNSKFEKKGTKFIPGSDGSYKYEASLTPFTTPLDNSVTTTYTDNDGDGSFIAHQDYIREDYMFTPGGSQRPPVQIYSKHFYNLLKK